jgi:glutamate/tyrosine decarboxylase-like PLP-dependent enzyme
VLVRKRSDLFQTFTIRPEYLRDAVTSDDHPNFSDYGIELTRPTRALKFWLTLQVLGEDELRRRIAHGVRQAERLEPLLAALPDCRIISHACNGLVSFRFEPLQVPAGSLDAFNSAIARRTQADGRCGILSTRLRNQTAMRICTLHPDANDGDLRITIDALRSAFSEELATTAAH